MSLEHLLLSQHSSQTVEPTNSESIKRLYRVPGFRFWISGFGFRVCGCGVRVLVSQGGLVFKAHRLCVSLNSRLESNKEKGSGARLDAEGGSVRDPPPLESGPLRAIQLSRHKWSGGLVN